MKIERQARRLCLVGILTIIAAGCSGSGGAEASGGAVTGGAASTGGGRATSSGTGGTTVSNLGSKSAASTGGTTASRSENKSAASSGGTTAASSGGTTAASSGGTIATSAGGTTAASSGGTTAASSGGTTAASSGGTISAPKVTVLLAGNDVNANGPLQTTVEDLSFSGGGHILVRPTNITKEPDTKHPVAIWGPGGGTPPRDYLMLLSRMASQGFVVVGIRESSGGSELMSAAIDWLEKQNGDSSSPMYNRLILDRVGVFGHSMGGLSSEATALVDRRVTTALLDNSGAFGHDQLVEMKVPVGIIYGEDGMERPNAEGDYNNPGNQGPCWLGMMAKGGHGSGPWDGAGANVAWMRWHIGGENSRRSAFLGNNGEYNSRGIWTTKSKNWDSWKNWNE